MSADTFTTALFLITAVIAAGVLISAIFLSFYQMAGIFTSAGHGQTSSPDRFQIILPFANESGYGRVLMKNTVGTQIALSDIARSDVICGDAGNFNRSSLSSTGTLSNGQWTYTLADLNNNNYWDPGETLEIDAYTTTIQPTDQVYFQFVLPRGVSISDQFTVTVPPS